MNSWWIILRHGLRVEGIATLLWQAPEQPLTATRHTLADVWGLAYPLRV